MDIVLILALTEDFQSTVYVSDALITVRPAEEQQVNAQYVPHLSISTWIIV